MITTSELVDRVITTSELADRSETSKLKDAHRVLPARQSGERLFLCAWRRGVHDLWGRWPPGVHDLWGRWPPGVFMTSEVVDLWCS